MSELLWACDCTGELCSNPKHNEFWMPENWPGGRAPVRWTYNNRSDDRAVDPENARFIRDDMGVDVWVPECCVGPEGAALWWASQDVPNSAPDRIKLWRKLEAEIVAEREPILDLRDSQDEAHWLPGAVPG